MAQFKPTTFRQPHRADYPPEVEIHFIWFGDDGPGARRYDILVITGPPGEDTFDDVVRSDVGHLRYRLDSHNPSVTYLYGPINAGSSHELPDYDLGFWQSRRTQIEELLFGATDAFLELLEDLLPDLEAKATLPEPLYRPHGRFLPRDRAREKAQFVEYGVRFVNPADYYRLFLNQRRLIVQHRRELFDVEAELTGWIDYWIQTEGEINVPGQRHWYANHGPEAGETAAVYQGKVNDFEALIAENLAVLDQLKRDPELLQL